MLWLRLLAIGNCFLIIPYYLFNASGAQFEPIAMAGVIVLINAANTAVLLKELRPPHLTAEQKRLHEVAFGRMPVRAMLKILEIGEFRAGTSGTVLLNEGGHTNEIYLISQGAVRISVEGQIVASLGEGRFVGEMAFVTKDLEATAKVELAGQAEYISWSYESLRQLENRDPDVYNQFFAALSVDLAKKVAERLDERDVKKTMGPLGVTSWPPATNA